MLLLSTNNIKGFVYIKMLLNEPWKTNIFSKTEIRLNNFIHHLNKEDNY